MSRKKYSEDSEYVVYRVENLVNGDCYIGITRHGVAVRWREHVRTAGYGRGYRLGGAIREFGSENFSITCICRCIGISAACREEIKQIEKWRPKYNTTKGGSGVPLKWSEAAKSKMSTIKKANPLRYWLGRKRSEETKRKISETKTGKPNPSAAGRPLLPWVLEASAQKRRKKVKHINSGKVYGSLTEAASDLGISKVHISKICRGGRLKTIYGNSFEFAA
jgi:Straboviridae intron-associated endonuclease 1